MKHITSFRYLYIFCLYYTGIIFPSTLIAQSYTWTKMPDMVYKSAALSAGTIEGKIYAIGGSNGVIHNNQYGDSYLQIYDPVQNKWKLGPLMKYPRMMLGTAVANGKIYAIGGGFDSYVSNKNEVYDPVANTWTELKERPVPASCHGAIALDEKIYTFGGLGAGDGTFPCYIYHINSDSWTNMAEIPIPAVGAASVSANDKIYVIGGISNTNTTLKTLQVYDTNTDTWESKSEMILPRFASVAAVEDGKIYVFGGAVFPTNIAQKDIQIYDIASDTWTQNPDFKLPVGTQWAGIIHSPDTDEIYILGGEDKCMLTYSNAVLFKYLYKLVLNTTNVFEAESERSSVLYPNPANDYIQIKLANTKASEKIIAKICNSLGEILVLKEFYVNQEQTSMVQINTGNIKPGIYFCTINHGSKTEIFKFSKN